MDNQIINKKIKEYKQQQIDKTNEDNKKLENEIKKILVVIIAMLSELYLKYNSSTRNLQQMKILQQLKKELVKYNKQLDKITKTIVYDSLRTNFLDTYDRHVELLKQYNKLQLDEKTYNKDEIKKIIQKKFYGKTLDKRIIDNNSLIMNKIYKTAEKSFKGNKPLDSILNDVSKIFTITAVGMDERLLNTESSRVFSEAQNKALEDSNITQLLWCADLCQNTCEYCAGNDGEAFPINDKPEIPAHANCNCFWTLDI